MKTIVAYLKSLIILVVIIILGYSFVKFYPYIFAKTIVGKIEKIEKVQLNVALMQTNPNAKDSGISPELYSFAVAIRDDKGEIFTASTEDRQWAAAQEGVCVKAKFFPYAPWNLSKSGTYYGARLLESRVCE